MVTEDVMILKNAGGLIGISNIFAALFFEHIVL
jgi:hypothetical protein